MRLLMVGPWRATAMRRHIDWAVESGIEVCVADYVARNDRTVPVGFRLARLRPRQSAYIHGAKSHRRSELSRYRSGLRLRHIAAAFQPDLVHSYLLGEYTDPCLQARLRPLVVSVWGSLNRVLTAETTPKDRRWLRRLRNGAHTLLVENPNMLRALTARSPAPLHVECFPIGIDGSLFPSWLC